MKTIIAGSRTINDYELLKFVINDCPFKVTSVVCGLAKGVDKMGERYALENGLPIYYFSANWNQHGKAAGPIRNRKMAEHAEALIWLWDGESKGTKNMIEIAKELGLKTHGAIFPEFKSPTIINHL